MVSRIKEVGSPKNKEVADEGSQTLPQPIMSTSDSRKRQREPTISQEVTATKKPEEKRKKPSKQPEEWEEVPMKKGPPKKRINKPRSEAVLIKPSEGVSYAPILKNLKSRVSPEALGIKIGGIPETRMKDLLVEVNCAAEDRGRLDSAFRDVVGESGSVRHLVPAVKLEIVDINPTAETVSPVSFG